MEKTNEELKVDLETRMREAEGLKSKAAQGSAQEGDTMKHAEAPIEPPSKTLETPESTKEKGHQKLDTVKQAEGPTESPKVADAATTLQQPLVDDLKNDQSTPMVPLTIAGTNGKNDPEMSSQKVAELKRQIQEARTANKPVRKNASVKSKATAKRTAKAKAKSAGKKKTKKAESEENTLDSEEPLSEEEPSGPPSSPEVEELDKA